MATTTCLTNPDDPTETKYVTPIFDTDFTDRVLDVEEAKPSYSEGTPTGPNINVGQLLESFPLIASVMFYLILTK